MKGDAKRQREVASKKEEIPIREKLHVRRRCSNDIFRERHHHEQQYATSEEEEVEKVRNLPFWKPTFFTDPIPVETLGHETVGDAAETQHKHDPHY